MYYQKVFKSPLNTSISKNIYTISKTQRFEQPKKSLCTKSFYDVNTSITKARSTTFGFGNRSDIANHSPTPDPSFYQYDHSPFKINKIKNRGFSFSIKQKNALPFQITDPNNPAPTKYNLFFRSNKGYTIRNKYEDPLEKNKISLGPGQYRNPESLSKTGVYFNAKFRNSLCSKIGKQKRFDDDSTVAPGPGAYKNKLSINRSGSYFDSRIKSNIVASFRGTQRPPINQNTQSPGPGTYYYFSQFGSRFSPKK